MCNLESIEKLIISVKNLRSRIGIIAEKKSKRVLVPWKISR
jgi:hypothetical protein